MNSPSPWRTRVIIAGVIGFWLVLAGRLVQIQILDTDKFRSTVERQRIYREPIPARPGDIVDRHGRLLATTVTVKSVFANPRRIDDPQAVAEQLATVLDVDAESLAEKLSQERKQFVWVQRRITNAAAEKLRSLELPPESVGFRDEFQRRYPQNELAAHVLGLRDIDGVGRGGIEESCHELLHGRDGERILIRDSRGRVIDVHEEVAAAPVHGRTVVLSLDAVLQMYVEKELDSLMTEYQPVSACAIVIEPHTGNLLALASRPAFNPNRPDLAAGNSWKNTAVSAVYEPGSTVKPLFVATALQNELVVRDEVFDCEGGAYRMGRRVLHDHHPYGQLSLTDVLVKSSNIGMAKLGERMTNDGLHQALVEWGFTQRTGIELPGELPGLVRPLSKWDEYSTGSIPMGQELAMTPLQLAAAHAALANGGRRTFPRLVLKHIDAVSGQGSSTPNVQTPPRFASKIVAADIADWVVRQPMVEVVNRGTGRQAQLPDYTVFGKTGTAQKPDPETKRYSKEKNIASFICGAPAKNPRAVVLVLVDEPRGQEKLSGGYVAAPAASRILQKTLYQLRVPTLARGGAR